MKSGSFHDVIVPELVSIFNQPYTLHCNELKHGGATYEMEWPYQDEFYSIHFPGTQANGNLDWQTWVMGIEYVSGKAVCLCFDPILLGAVTVRCKSHLFCLGQLFERLDRWERYSCNRLPHLTICVEQEISYLSKYHL